MGEGETHRYVDDQAAADWLLLNREDEAHHHYFGEPASERGPGRPEVGGLVQIRLGDLLERVDGWAETPGVSRAEAVRQLVVAGLEGLGPPLGQAGGLAALSGDR